MNEADLYMEIRDFELDTVGLFRAPEIRPTAPQPLLKRLVDIVLPRMTAAAAASPQPPPGPKTR